MTLMTCKVDKGVFWGHLLSAKIIEKKPSDCSTTAFAKSHCLKGLGALSNSSQPNSAPN